MLSIRSVGVAIVLLLSLMLASIARCDEILITKDGPVRVNNWGYELQGAKGSGGELRPEFIASAAHDLVVMDYARYGDEASKFTPAEVSRMENSDPAWGGNGLRKVVVSYVSIGEISDFRSFWDPKWTTNGKASGQDTIFAPAWLGPINPDWPEGRKVRYWDPDWQTVIYNDAHTGWLDQVVMQGFDGAYLDIVDAYYYWFEEGERTELQAAQEMIDFITGMAAHARLMNPDFLIIPQNAEAILDVVKDADPVRYSAYVAAISAIGSEDVYFFGNRDMNNRFNPQQFVIGVLQRDFQGNGVPVFVVDYVNQSGKIAQLYDAAIADGFYPYAAPDRELSKLAIPGPGVPDMVLAVDQLKGGATSNFSLSNGTANESAYLVYSTNAESGATYYDGLDIAIFMENPKLAGEVKQTNGNGMVEWVVDVPSGASGVHVRLQGLQMDRSTNVIAGVVE